MEVPPLRSFVFVITFLGVFVLLLTMGTASCPELFSAPEIGREQPVSEYFEASDIEVFADIVTICLNETGGQDKGGGWYWHDADIGGHDVDLWYKKANETVLELMLEHLYVFLYIFPMGENLEWFNYQGVSREYYLQDDELNADMANPEYTAECQHFPLTVYFAYNTTLYNNFTQAWNFHALWMRICIDWEEQATGMNAWSIIGMVLFFNMPKTHLSLNFIIALPLWITIIWLTVAFIIAFIKALPFT